MPEQFAQKSFVGLLVESVGAYGLLIPLSELLALVLILVLLLRGRGPSTGFAVCLIAPLPIVVAIFGLLQRGITMLSAVATSDPATPQANSGAYFAMLFIAMFGLMISVPGYGVATLASVGRILLTSKTKQTSA